MKAIRTIKVVVNDFNTRDRDFYIFSTIIDGKEKFGAIEHKDVDENGHLTKELNGIQLFLHDTISGVIEAVEKSVTYDWYRDRGFGKAEAFAAAYNLPVESVRQAFAL